MSARKILITGANGFLGAALARALATHGDDVRCLVRPQSDASSLQNLPVKRVPGDVTDASSLEPAVEGIHTVFHLAGIRRGTSRDEFMAVNAEGTRLVAQAMVKANARRLVLVGSLAATGPSFDGQPRKEDDAFAPQEWYGESKAEAERIAFSFSPSLEVTCCRPSRILGPDDKENLVFFRLVKKGIVLKLLGPRRELSFVDVDDVVKQLMLQATASEAIGESFFCASREKATLEELMRMVADILHLKTRTVPVPESVLRALGTGADITSRLLGRKLPLNRKLVRQLLAPGWTCDTTKARDVLGFEARITLLDSVKRSCESYRKAGWI